MRLAALSICVGVAACGRYNLPAYPKQDGAAPAARATLGAVDLTKAPASLALSCPGVAPPLALEMPCLVGMNIASPPSGVGLHEVECHTTQPGEPLVWSFLLPLSSLAQNPDLVLSFPDRLPNGALPPGEVDLGSEKARVSGGAGTLAFTRVDPEGRAFEGSFRGTLVLTGESTRSEITCDVDGPFWGAPGNFL